MSNVVRRPFVLICVPLAEDDRFAIVFHETVIAQTFPPRPGERWADAMRRYFEDQQLFSESAVREQLAALGVDEGAANARIREARQRSRLNQEFAWDHVTSLGFRNREGQMVVRKTDRDGRSPGQRVFVLRCTVCGHEYGCDGCDIYDRLCPRCQGGPPGS